MLPELNEKFLSKLFKFNIHPNHTFAHFRHRLNAMYKKKLSKYISTKHSVIKTFGTIGRELLKKKPILSSTVKFSDAMGKRFCPNFAPISYFCIIWTIFSSLFNKLKTLPPPTDLTNPIKFTMTGLNAQPGKVLV